MTKEDLLQKMFSAFGKGYSEDSQALVAEETKTESVESFNKAVSYFLTHTNTLPSPIVFVRKVRTSAMEGRESKARIEKLEHLEPSQPAKGNPKIVEACSFLIGQFNNGQITRREFVNGMARLEDKFPGCGFMEQAEVFHLHHDKHGNDMDALPVNVVTLGL